jgi:uncharacterized protein (DUF2141 family)
MCVIAVGCGGAPPAGPPTITLGVGTGAIEAKVIRVKSGSGPIGCDLFNSETGFPGPSPIIGGAVNLEAASTEVTCRYEKLPEGNYALSVFQDENKNGTLDTSIFGAPVEGYGASNNKLPPTSGPTWAESSFAVGTTTVQLEVRLQN